MKRSLAAAGPIAALALAAGCGTASGHASQGSPSAAALPTVSRGDAGRFCAGLVALARAEGASTAALRTAEQGAWWFPRAHRAADAAASVHLRCPQYVHLLPQRYR